MNLNVGRITQGTYEVLSMPVSIVASTTKKVINFALKHPVLTTGIISIALMSVCAATSSSDEILDFPSADVLGECLKKSPLLDSPWIEEKGVFFDILKDFFEDRIFCDVEFSLALRAVMKKIVDVTHIQGPTTFALKLNIQEALRSCAINF